MICEETLIIFHSLYHYGTSLFSVEVYSKAALCGVPGHTRLFDFKIVFKANKVAPSLQCMQRWDSSLGVSSCI